MLRATSDILVPDAEGLLSRLCAHFAEHGEVVVANGESRISLGYGTGILRASGGTLSVVTEALDAVYLSYMKMGVAEHIVEMTEAPAPVIRWNGDGADAVVPPFFREMRVVSASSPTPRMRRVRLSGEDLHRFDEGGFHVRLLFPPQGRAPIWPTLGPDGRIVWPQRQDALQTRIYTIRTIDTVEGWVDIDILLHGGEATPGSVFAENAAPGDLVGMTGPGGSGAPEHDRLFLFGDETALPAIGRMLERLPPEARASVVVEVEGPDEEIALPSRATTDIVFLHRGGGAGGQLAAAVRATDLDLFGSGRSPDIRPFVWVGCEFDDFRAIRSYLRQERGLAREDHLVVAYWRRGRAGDEARRET